MVRGPATAQARGASHDGEASVLGRGARVRGRIGGDGDLRVEGQVEGNVVVSGELTSRRAPRSPATSARRPWW